MEECVKLGPVDLVKVYPKTLHSHIPLIPHLSLSLEETPKTPLFFSMVFLKPFLIANL